jgi:uncharacterized protein (UPF0261 family)
MKEIMTHDTGQHVYAVGTMDTKGEELDFVAGCLRNAGVATKTVDVGTGSAPIGIPDITRHQVTGSTDEAVSDDRGTAVTAMGESLRLFLLDECEQSRVAGVIGIGGSGGTALVTAGMRALGIGLPKIMVSTVASGDTSSYVDCSDIAMMYSVVDVAGLNDVSRRVFSNAAHAMAGMVSHKVSHPPSQSTIGMTMFGVTTPCLSMIRKSLEQQGYECLVFHATGTGGRAMEQLVESGLIQGVLDMTTTEVADELVGGVFASGPDRFDRILASEVPFVLSLGALDMVNFGAIETVPEKFKNRKLHVHNAQVTLMRTSPEENEAFAIWMTEKLNKSTTPITVLIPELGISALDAPGEEFHDPEANTALFDTLALRLHQTEDRRLLRLPFHINDREFSQAAVSEFLSLMQQRK